MPQCRPAWVRQLIAVWLVGLLIGVSWPARPAAAAVNTDTGNYVYQYTDIRVQDDPSFAFTRTYNSLDARTGPLGPGWTHNFNVRLVLDTVYGPNSWAFVGPDGRTERYMQRADGGFRLAGAQGGVLIQHGDGPFAGTWELAEPDGTHYELLTDGRPSRITYADKSTVLLNYDEAGRLQAAARPTGERRLTFAYDDGDHLVSVSDWLDRPRTIGFGYDDLGRLVTSTDRLGNVTRYSYEGDSQRLRELVDPRGHVALRHEYDADGRVVKQWTARGVQSNWPTTFAYGRAANASTYPADGYSTTLTYPPSGYAPTEPVVVIHTYDGLGRLVRQETRPAPDDEPLVEEYRWDASWNRSVQPALGGRTQSDIGPETGGQCLLAASVPGLDRTIQIGRPFQSSPATPPVPTAMPIDRRPADGWTARDPHFDQAGRLIGLTLEQRGGQASEAWTFALDDEDHVVETVAKSASGEIVRTAAFRYDEVGNLVEQRASDGAVTRYEYDERDALAAEYRPDGQTVRYEYDERGYLSKLSTTPADGADAHVVEYQHDGLGRLRRIVDHAGTAGDSAAVTTELSYQQYTLVAVCQR